MRSWAGFRALPRLDHGPRKHVLRRYECHLILVFHESSQMFQSRLLLKDNLVHLEESVRVAPNISRLISAMRRQARLFTAFCLAGVAFGTLYLLTAKPLYTASTNVFIDNRQVRAMDVSKLFESSILENGEVES